MPSLPNPVLSIEHLTVTLPEGRGSATVLDDVSLTVGAGETVCIVGESGSGKSMTARAVMRLLPPGAAFSDKARITFSDQNLLASSEAEMRQIRGARIGMIFQEPMTALNPLRRIGWQISEVFSLHTRLSRSVIRQKVLDLISSVGIAEPERIYRSYPHELSGGQRQRAMIAMALALEPHLLIADEPTTALDVTTQARILRLIKDVQERTGTAVLFITHDFGVVSEIADRVVVMRTGRVIEEGKTDALLNRPVDLYTQQLIAAVPKLTPKASSPPVSPAALTVSGLSKIYRKRSFLGGGATTYALRPTDLILPARSTLGVVGESGSGKSTLARCIVGLVRPDTGSVDVNGTDFAKLTPRARRRRSREIQMVFQDPQSSLNPRRRAGDLVSQGLIVHGETTARARARTRELFELVGLDPSTMDRYPHEFSGGQRQRIGLARALALEPSILIADEPVSALDVSVQAQVLELLASLQQKLGLSVIFITHDLRVAAQICDRVAVMRHGEIVEQGLTAEVFNNPRHDYTRRLLESVPGRAWSGTDELVSACFEHTL
ncbi:microcin ABC transporter ATP-binding protein (plasmid) [Microvirga ossetica]|uniref:Microcin ABC transporter ATP-binding protein n=2 Tax=Microvirga ossetica TaxID=1882682 RepID=A0A1B2EZJ8_9HYPH|nr:microcin ABC transporter ATP-binding protein [Microvirga ossetica]